MVLLLVSCLKNDGLVLIENDSDKDIALVKLKICGQESMFENIAKANSVQWSYTVSGDCNFDIFVHFVGGEKIAGQVGYVTTGADYKDKIVIKNSDIGFERLEVN